jgi:hypothetical protein
MVNRYRRWLDDQRLIVTSMVSRRCTQAPAVTDQGTGQGIYWRDAVARLRLWMPSGQHVRPRPDNDLPGAGGQR